MKARAPPPKYRGKHLVLYQLWNLDEAYNTGKSVEVDLFTLPPYVAQGIMGLRKTGVQLQSGIIEIVLTLMSSHAWCRGVVSHRR